MDNHEIPVLRELSRNQADPVIIRGHTLLCLQGFRGEGYSPDFIDNMAAIHARLQSNPETQVRVTDTPDYFCAACPNLKGSQSVNSGGRSGKEESGSSHALRASALAQNGGCTLRGPDFEQHIVSQDRQVLDLLGLRVGQETAWAEVLQRIGSRMRGEMLDGICGDCQWLSLGYCKEGIEQLRTSTHGKRQGKR